MNLSEILSHLTNYFIVLQIIGLVGDSKKVDGKEHLAKAQSLISPFYLSGENSSRIHIMLLKREIFNQLQHGGS